MEDVLDVYKRPYDANRPVVCLDEASRQLLDDTRAPLPMQPVRSREQKGTPLREDSEYERKGTINLFMCFEPLAGQRHVEVTDRRTALDFAAVVKDLLTVRYAEAETVVLVMDNLNTHKASNLYEAFPAAEARRLCERLEIHHTPRHGSWLNMAEIEFVRSFASVFRPSFARQRAGDFGSGGMGTRPKYSAGAGELALHDRRCPHETETSLSKDTTLTD